MRDMFSALSGVGLVALAAAALAVPTAAQAQAEGGSVTLTADQWQALQQQLNQDRQDIEQLKAAQAATQQQASDAQTAATQARAEAKTTEKALVPLSWAADTKVSGRMYFNLSKATRKTDGDETESDGGFQIKRFYLGVDHKFNNVLSGNITTDISQINGVGRTLYVKKAYLQATFSPAATVRLGSADMPWIPYAEGIYGFRYVENTLIDRTSFGTSADWGVHVLGTLGHGLVSYQVSAVDGGGYRNPTFTKAVDLEGRVSAQYKGFNVAVGGYTGKLGKDQQGVATFHTASRFNALAAYKTKLFTLGGEYFHAKNWTQVTTPVSDAAEGWSLFGNINPIPDISVFARYDWVKPHKDTQPDLKDHYVNAGIQYTAFKNVDLALVYKHDRADNGLISTSNGTIGGVKDGTYDEFGIWGMFQF